MPSIWLIRISSSFASKLYITWTNAFDHRPDSALLYDSSYRPIPLKYPCYIKRIWTDWQPSADWENPWNCYTIAEQFFHYFCSPIRKSERCQKRHAFIYVEANRHHWTKTVKFMNWIELNESIHEVKPTCRHTECISLLFVCGEREKATCQTKIKHTVGW